MIRPPKILPVLAGAFVALLLLGGCTVSRQGDPAPVVQHNETALPPDAVGSTAAQPGETVYDVAKRANVPVRDLIEMNRLTPPYALQPGQVLALPRAKTHTVQKGDTLYSISRFHRIDMAELARINGIQPPYHVILGQTLRLPGTGKEAPLPTVATAAPIPTAAVPAPARKPAPAKSASAKMPPMAPAPAPVKAAARPGAAVEQPPPRAGSRFAWPVKGSILSNFGPKPDGVHNDGLNIAAPRGTAVVAAENGVVAYAGNELKGFGNLLLIRHADGWMTAYAHLDQMSVQRGDRVKRGQKIGTVGSTGNVSQPQLHFEIRQGSRAVNPRDHLAGRISQSALRDDQPGPG